MKSNLGKIPVLTCAGKLNYERLSHEHRRRSTLITSTGKHHVAFMLLFFLNLMVFCDSQMNGLCVVVL